MSLKVTIKYVGPSIDVSDVVRSEICRTFQPAGSYIDTPAYEGTCYDTNVPGWGKLPGLLPMANTTTRFAQFERAVMAALTSETNEGIEFDIGDNYMEEIYWSQMAKAMACQGFEIKVKKK